jgi:hypothetical protein
MAKSFFEERAEYLATWTTWATGLYAREGVGAIFTMMSEPTPPSQMFKWDALWQVIVNANADKLGPDELHVDFLMHSREMQVLYKFLATTFESVGQNGRANANSTLQQMWHQWLHFKTGRKVFEVSPALAEYLKYTEFRGVTTDALKLPYKHCYISVPTNADLSFTNDPSQAKEWKVPEVNPVRAVAVMEQDEVYDDSSRNGRRWNFFVMGAPGEVVNKKLNVRDHVVFSFDVFLRSGVPVEEVIEQKEQSLHTAPEYMKALYSDSDQNGLAPYWRGFFKWCMSVLLYATWPGAEIEEGWDNRYARFMRDRIAKLPPGKKKDRLKNDLKSIDPQPRIYLGMKMSPLAVRQRLAREEGDHRAALVRLLVTGHWRNQAFGEGRSERKLIWIKPYWRGDPEAPLHNPERVLLAPEERR